MVSFFKRLGKTAGLLVKVLREGCGLGASRRREDRAQDDGWRVYTSVHDGRKYVKSSEVVKSAKAKRQMDQLRKIIRKRT